MASVKEMRTRIASVKSTQKITKAMQMVAAAKLRRAQTSAEAARPYARQMANVIGNLAAGVSGPDAPRLLVGTGSDKRHLVVVATSDRGLAGGFNSGIVRAARDKIAALLAEGVYLSAQPDSSVMAVVAMGLAVGGVTERNVPALIAQPGQLRTSLLGMSFLNRLESWEVRGDKLRMRAAP